MVACRQPGYYESQLLQLIVVKRARPWPRPRYWRAFTLVSRLDRRVGKTNMSDFGHVIPSSSSTFGPSVSPLFKWNALAQAASRTVSKHAEAAAAAGRGLLLRGLCVILPPRLPGGGGDGRGPAVGMGAAHACWPRTARCCSGAS